MTKKPQSFVVYLLVRHPLARHYIADILGNRPMVLLTSLEDACLLKPGSGIFVIDGAILPPPREQWIEQLLFQHPNTHAIVLMGREGEQQLLPLLRAGVRGLVRYEDVRKHLPAAVDTVGAGKVWFRPDLLRSYVVWTQRPSRPTAPKGKFLTPREIQVFHQLEQGNSNREVGEKFGIALSTVKEIVSNVLSKCQLRSRWQICRVTAGYGIRPTEELKAVLD